MNWSGTSNSKFYKRIPFNFDLGSFYKEFTYKKMFTRKSFVKFFPTFKLKLSFIPIKKLLHQNSKIGKKITKDFPVKKFFQGNPL